MSNLPAVNVSQLSTSLTEARTRISLDSPDGLPFLRLLKSGEWVYSADDVDVLEGSVWAVNPSTLAEGFCAWSNGELVGEQMAPMTGTPVLLSQLPDVGAQWKKQIAFMLQCLDGEDEGVIVLYKTTSKGGIKASNKLIAEIIKQIDDDPEAIVPMVKLETDNYKHKEYGKIYTPIFEVESFMGFDGMPDAPSEPEAEADEPEDEPEQIEKDEAPAEKPKARRRATPAAEPEAPAKRRRRPVAK